MQVMQDSHCFVFAAFSHVMKGVEGFQNEGYTIMTLMRMTFGEFDVSSDLVNVPRACFSFGIAIEPQTLGARIVSCFNKEGACIPRHFKGKNKIGFKRS